MWLPLLKDKRAELSGSVADLEKRIGQHQANLRHVDAVLRLSMHCHYLLHVLSKGLIFPGWESSILV